MFAAPEPPRKKAGGDQKGEARAAAAERTEGNAGSEVCLLGKGFPVRVLLRMFGPLACGAP